MDMTVLNRIPTDTFATAKELNIAAATLTALVKKGLIVADKSTRPYKYKRDITSQNYTNLMDALNETKQEFAHAYYDDRTLGDLLIKTARGWALYDNSAITGELVGHIVHVDVYYTPGVATTIYNRG